MRNKAIGVFDSGVGGLSCVKELFDILKNEDIIYLGDTKRMPYGVNSKQILTEYTINNIDFLNSKDVKIVVAACGTVSTNVDKAELLNLKTEYLDLILPTVKKAISLTKNKKIAIIATNSTVNSRVFEKIFNEMDKELNVLSIACPELVTLIEKGHINDEIIENKASEYLKDVIDFKADTLILGCTHFPIISSVIEKILENKVSLVNSGEELAKEIKRFLIDNDLLKQDKEKGSASFFATSNIEGFNNISKIFLGEDKKANAVLVKINERECTN